MYQFRSEPDLLRLLNNRRNNKDCDGLRDEINHQPSKKSQHSLIINNRLTQHQQVIKSHQLNRQQSQQKFLSDSKSEGMMINSPLQNQDENLNLLTCDNNSPDRPSDNQHNSTIKTKIGNSRLSLSDLSLTRQTQPVVSSSLTNQQRLKNLRLVGLLTRLRPKSEEPKLSNQTIDPESINHQSEPTTQTFDQTFNTHPSPPLPYQSLSHFHSHQPQDLDQLPNQSQLAPPSQLPSDLRPQI
ncbi:hypothetical protein PPACK8108_LOCUS6351 [Phakopsora pachyrhizi]|uniref:Uncharacterized protein n=1 Tax=Phakopsora pachyrhizi TaxID=170000 RepID=A0AAV0AS34_PHAPC|nr:hypothetical protein PPACK8108_LOCUS6351 [Phakopsora pachyrhizi]